MPFFTYLGRDIIILVKGVDFLQQESNIVEWTQAISAIGTAVAAIAAMVTTFQNRKSIKDAEKERHGLIKPIFRVERIEVNKKNKIIKLTIRNVGFEKVKNVNIFWEGDSGVTAKLRKVVRPERLADDHELELSFYEAYQEPKDIEGKIQIAHTDVLGKTYKENVDVFIENKYYEFPEEYSPELKPIHYKIFE